MKQKLLWDTHLLTIFLRWKVRKTLKMAKGPSSKTGNASLTSLLTIRPRMSHICGFLDCFSFSHFFRHFLMVLELTVNFNEFWAKFSIKQVTFCCLDVLVFYCAINQYSEIGCAFSEIFLKKVLTLRVN